MAGQWSTSSSPGPVFTPHSAVAAFWKTFSPHDIDEGASKDEVSSHKMSSNLPAELLLIIFRLVYEQEIFHPGALWRRGDHELHSPNLFPHAIAAVCSLWRDVMALVPEFWTRVVILIDWTPTITMSDIISHISWSGDLPLQIVITRTNFDRRMVDVEHERMQIMSIMDTAINPCMHRLIDLSFDVMFSSSLPPFPDVFAANYLDNLQLVCKEDVGKSLDIWASIIPTAPGQQYSSLWSLTIHGRNYYNTYKGSFWQTGKFTSLRVLTIANYTPLPGETFTSSDFLLPFTHLEALKSLNINNVTLVPSHTRPPTPLSPRYLAQLELTDIHTSETFVEILGSLRDIPELFFIQCAIGDPGVPFGGEGGELTLEDLDADQDLIPLLRHWEGDSLTISNCPSFGDAVLLDMMACNDAENICAARNLATLFIHNCDNFSGASLRHLVHARKLIGRKITELDVCGCVPEVSAEDQKWLSQAVDYFDYDPSQKAPPESSSSLASSSGS